MWLCWPCQRAQRYPDRLFRLASAPSAIFLALVGESLERQASARISICPVVAFGHDDVEAPIYVWTPQPEPTVEVVAEVCDTLDPWLSATRIPFVFIVMSDQIRSNDAEHR